MTDDTGMLQHAIFSVPNTREGYTTDDNARALIVSTLLDENQAQTGGREFLTSPIVTCLFYGSPFMPIRAGSGTFLVTTASGLKMWARMTVMAARCGLWEKCWVIRKMQD